MIFHLVSDAATPGIKTSPSGIGVGRTSGVGPGNITGVGLGPQLAQPHDGLMTTWPSLHIGSTAGQKMSHLQYGQPHAGLTNVSPFLHSNICCVQRTSGHPTGLLGPHLGQPHGGRIIISPLLHIGCTAGQTTSHLQYGQPHSGVTNVSPFLHSTTCCVQKISHVQYGQPHFGVTNVSPSLHSTICWVHTTSHPVGFLGPHLGQPHAGLIIVSLSLHIGSTAGQAIAHSASGGPTTLSCNWSELDNYHDEWKFKPTWANATPKKTAKMINFIVYVSFFHDSQYDSIDRVLHFWLYVQPAHIFIPHIL